MADSTYGIGETIEQFEARAAAMDPKWHAQMKAHTDQREAGMREFLQRVLSMAGGPDGMMSVIRFLQQQQQPSQNAQQMRRYGIDASPVRNPNQMGLPPPTIGGVRG